MALPNMLCVLAVYVFPPSLVSKRCFREEDIHIIDRISDQEVPEVTLPHCQPGKIVLGTSVIIRLGNFRLSSQRLSWAQELGAAHNRLPFPLPLPSLLVLWTFFTAFIKVLRTTNLSLVVSSFCLTLWSLISSMLTRTAHPPVPSPSKYPRVTFAKPTSYSMCSR